MFNNVINVFEGGVIGSEENYSFFIFVSFSVVVTFGESRVSLPKSNALAKAECIKSSG